MSLVASLSLSLATPIEEDKVEEAELPDAVAAAADKDGAEAGTEERTLGGKFSWPL